MELWNSVAISVLWYWCNFFASKYAYNQFHYFFIYCFNWKYILLLFFILNSRRFESIGKYVMLFSCHSFLFSRRTVQKINDVVGLKKSYLLKSFKTVWEMPHDVNVKCREEVFSFCKFLWYCIINYPQTINFHKPKVGTSLTIFCVIVYKDSQSYDDEKI